MDEKKILEDGAELVGVDEIPEEYGIFGKQHIEYLMALTGDMVLRELKGQLLNIVEGCGMPDKQEVAVKRMVTNALHEWHRDFGENLELVRVKCATCAHLSSYAKRECVYCGKELTNYKPTR